MRPALPLARQPIEGVTMAWGNKDDQIDERSVVEAMFGDNIRRFHAWKDLSGIAQIVEFDGLKVSEGTVRRDGDKFTVDVYVDVGLYYNDDRTFADADSFPGVLHGHLEDGKRVVIDEIDIDPRSLQA